MSLPEIQLQRNSAAGMTHGRGIARGATRGDAPRRTSHPPRRGYWHRGRLWRRVYRDTGSCRGVWPRPRDRYPDLRGRPSRESPAGAALGGLRPVADVQYGDFLFLAMDQLANQAAKLRYMSGGRFTVPMVMRAPVGATTRGAQHGQSLEAFFMHVPGLKVACPSNPYDGKGLLKTAIRDDNPVIFFEHKLLYGSKGATKEAGGIEVMAHVPEEEYLIPFGQAKIVRPGRDMTIVANLLMVHRSLQAARRTGRSRHRNRGD